MTAYIYGLIDPRNDELRYVGKSLDPRKRLSSHIKQSENTNQTGQVSRWIRELTAACVKPELVLIEKVEGDWETAERFWIKELRAAGYRLTNALDGGGGPKPKPKPVDEPLRWWRPENNPPGKKRIMETHP